MKIKRALIRILVGAVVAVLTIVVLKFVLVYQPFNSDVWGAVSDWVMIGVTAVTAYFLYHTLKAQQTVTKIAVSEYVDRIRPNFQLSADKYGTKQITSDEKLVYFNAVLKVLNHDARNVRVALKKNMNKKTLKTLAVQYDYWEKDYKHPVARCEIKVSVRGGDKFQFYFFIEFTDVTGENHYSKKIKIHNKDDDFSVKVAPFDIKSIEKLSKKAEIESFRTPSDDNSREF